MTGERRQSIAELAARQAPLRPRRAAAITLAVVDEVLHVARSHAPMTLDPERIDVDENGAIHIDEAHGAHVGRPTGPSPGRPDPDPGHVGADVGHLLFLLLVGRPPRGSEDAFEPHVRTELSSELTSLLARSCSPSPGQWPGVAEWAQPLALFAGAASPGPPPHRVRERRRRKLVLGIALAALIAVTATVLLLTPGWWDKATDEGGFSQTVDRAANDIAAD